MQILKDYSNKCEVVVELGVNQVNSTFAFLASNCKEVHSIDIDLHKRPIKNVPRLDHNIWMNHALLLADNEDKFLKFYECNSIDMKFDSIDLLFIDTEHSERQLTLELFHYGPAVKKYIIMHDTVLFGPQLQPAINKFLKEFPEWSVESVYTNSPGLTILKRFC